MGIDTKIQNQHNFLFRNGAICCAFFDSGKYRKQEAIHYDIVCHMRCEFVAFYLYHTITYIHTLHLTKCTSTANICLILSCELFSHMTSTTNEIINICLIKNHSIHTFNHIRHQFGRLVNAIKSKTKRKAMERASEPLMKSDDIMINSTKMC